MSARRLATLGVGLAVGVGLGGCAERQLDFESFEAERRVACVPLPARGRYPDGSIEYIRPPGRDGTVAVCMCMTDEEMDEGVYDDLLNDRAVEECEAAAAPYGFEWDDCQENYETGVWYGFAVFVEDLELESLNYEGLTCGDEPVEGCALAGRRPPSLMGLLLLLGLVGLGTRNLAGSELSRARR